MADPFFSSCAESAQAVVRANDPLFIVTASQNDPHTEIENVNILMSHRVDGLLIARANSRSQALCDLVGRLAVPIVSIDRPIFNSSVSSIDRASQPCFMDRGAIPANTLLDGKEGTLPG